MTLRPKLQKLSNFELRFLNKPQNLADILPKFISGTNTVHFYGKKGVFRWGLKEPKYAGTDRVKIQYCSIQL